MPVFTAAAASIVTAAGFTAGTTSFLIAQSVVAAGLAYTAGKVTGVFDEPDLGSLDGLNFEDPGVEARLGVNTQNAVPHLYGRWMSRGMLSYYEVSADRQILHTVITLGEGQTGNVIDKIYWDEFLLTLDDDGNVTNAVDAAGTTTTRFNGNVVVHTYPTGGRSTYLEGVSSTWDETCKMTGLAYAVVSTTYNRDDDITGLGDMRFVGTAPIDNPADAVEDLLTNSTYGLGLSTNFINSTSFTAAQTYYNSDISYTDRDGNAATRKRFTVNGALSSEASVKDRISEILRGCNSSLRWSNGQYGIFVNKADTAVAFTFDESNIIGNVSVAEIGFNNLINEVEINYGRDSENNWTRNTIIIRSPDSVRYPNELDRKHTIELPLISSSIEAEYIGNVLLNQSRQQLSVKHRADATAMPLEAGDVVSYTDTDYGWSNKQFRILSISEREEDGAITYDVTAVEYADAVYDATLNEVDVAPNAPLITPNVIPAVDTLELVAAQEDVNTPYIEVRWSVPNNALIEAFDVFVNREGGGFNDTLTVLYGTERPTGANTYTAGDIINTRLTGLTDGDYNIWVVGRNDYVSSAASNAVFVPNWDPVGGAAGALQTVYRFHTNLPNNDPGPPTGMEGLGGGWYAGRDSNLNDNPRWEAVTTARNASAENRILDFEFSGNTAEPTLTQIDTEQTIEFTLSGNTAEQVVVSPAQQGRWTLSASGETAEVDEEIPAKDANFRIYIPSGSSDSEQLDITEQFFIHPTGTSRDYGYGLARFTFDGFTNVTGDTETFTTPISGVINDGDQNVLDYSVRDLGAELSGETHSTVNGFDTITFNETNIIDEIEIAVGGFGVGPSQHVASRILQVNQNTTNQDVVYEAGEFNADANFRFAAPSTASDDFYLNIAGIKRVRVEHRQGGNDVIHVVLDSTSSVEGYIPNNVPMLPAGDRDSYNGFAWSSTGHAATTYTLNLTQGSYSYSRTFTPPQGAEPGSLSGSDVAPHIENRLDTDADFTSNFTAINVLDRLTINALTTEPITATMTISNTQDGASVERTSFTAGFGEPSSVRLIVGDYSINETVELGRDVTGSDLVDDIVTRFNAVEDIRDRFTVESAFYNVDNTGPAEQIVRLTAVDPGNISISIVKDDISDTAFNVSGGTIRNGFTGLDSTQVGITFDSDWISGQQIYSLGDGPNPYDIAINLAAAIDDTNIENLTATAVNGNTAANTYSTSLVTEDTIQVANIDGLIFSSNRPAISFREGVPTTDQDAWDIGTDVTTWSQLANNGLVFGTESVLTLDVDSQRIMGIAIDSTNWALLRLRMLPSFGVSTYGFAIEEVISSAGAPSVVTDAQVVYTDGNDVDVLGFDWTYNQVNNTLTRQGMGAYVDLVYDEQAEQTAPTVTITKDGTTSDLPVINVVTIEPGAAQSESSGVFTRARITFGGQENTVALSYNGEGNERFITLAIGEFIEDNFAVESVSYTNNFLTLQTIDNSDSELSIEIIQGINAPGNDGANDAAITLTQTQVGRAEDLVAGTDTTLSLRMSDSEFATVNVGGFTRAQVASAIEDEFDDDGRYNASVSGNVVTLQSTFTGLTPSANIVVTRGEDSAGNPGTLTIGKTVVEDGTTIGETAGQLSRYTITQGGVQVANGTLQPGNGGIGIAQAILSELIGFATEFTYSREDAVVTATSVFLDSTPDLVIEITPGTDSDGTTATAAVNRTIVQAGNAGSLDLTDAEWEYFVIDGTVVDTDLLTQTDGVVSVNRGLILDSTATTFVAEHHASGDAPPWAYDTDWLTTDANRDSVLVIQGAMTVFTSVTTAASPVLRIAPQIEVSTNGGVSWTDVYDIPNAEVILGSVTISSGVHETTVFLNTPISMTLPATKNTAYEIRARLVALAGGTTATDLTGNAGFQLLALEELAASS